MFAGSRVFLFLYVLNKYITSIIKKIMAITSNKIVIGPLSSIEMARNHNANQTISVIKRFQKYLLFIRERFIPISYLK